MFAARETTSLSDLITILLLVLANGFFAGAEIALVAIRRTRLQELADLGNRGARAALKLRAQPERLLATVQVGITLVSASAAAFAGASIAERIAPIIAELPLIGKHAEEIALALVVIAVSYLSIVLGELVPKSLALRSAERFAMIAARPLLTLSWLARPLIWFLTSSSNVVLRPFGDRTTFTETRHSPEELQQLVEEAMRAGTVNPHAGEIAARALEFPELTAADVMVARQEVVMLPRRASPDKLRHILLEQTHTRFPVYEDRIDNVVGYVSIKDVLALSWEQKLIILEDIIRPPYFVPESMRAVDLLQEMKKRHLPMAIVVDETGGTSGIVTTEDLIEELVGEIFSEHSKTEIPLPIKRDGDGSYLIQAQTPLREINRELELDMPVDGDFSTIAGLCLQVVGRIPSTGERVKLPSGHELEIVDASARRIRMIRLHPHHEESSGDIPTSG